MNSEMLAEYALGTLEPEEAREVETLLARSSAARSELLKLHAALVALAEALPQHAPSAAAWQRLQAAFVAETTERKAPPVLRDRAPRTSVYGWLAAACLALVALGAGLWGAGNFRAAQSAQAEQRLVALYLSAPEVRRVALYAGQDALGSVLLAGERALFVLADGPGPQRVYQAWGHRTTDWEPGGERLTSLAVSGQPVFEAAAGQFAALYLSVEPRGGSDQPTRPLARVSLVAPVSERPITLVQPEPGALVGSSIVVRGLVSSAVAELSYRLNGGESRPAPLAGGSFAFTLTGLPPGENTLILTAALRGGGEAQERATFTAP